jgi:hypothetical protein
LKRYAKLALPALLLAALILASCGGTGGSARKEDQSQGNRDGSSGGMARMDHCRPGVAPDGCPPPDQDGDGGQNFEDNCDNEAGPASNGGCPNRLNVRDYGATPNDSTNDSAAFESAMRAAVQGGGVAYVPGGGYRITHVQIPSGTTLEIEAAATIRKYSEVGSPLFVMQGTPDRSLGHDMHVRGVNGRALLDLNDAGQDTAAFRIRGVRDFSIKNLDCRQNWDNHQQEYPSSRKPCLSLLPVDQTRLASGEWEAPTNGQFTNLHSYESPYGWGLVQITGGRHLDFDNISSQGGIALRLENFETNWAPMFDITADGVRCVGGHEAVGFNPHGAQHDGNLHVTNVRVESCESGIGFSGTGTYGPNVTVDGLTVVPGNTAQVRDPDPNQTYVGAWLIGESKWCIQDKTDSYNVQVTNVDCNGLPNGKERLLGGLRHRNTRHAEP